MKFDLECDGIEREIIIRKVDGQDERFEVSIGDKTKRFCTKSIWGRNFVIVDENNKVYDVFVDQTDEGHCVFFKGRSFVVKDADKRKKRTGFELEGEVLVKSPLSGQVKRIMKKEGDAVKTGDGILVLEAMKMENEIKAPKKGKIKKIFVEESGAVNTAGKLFIID